jgi:uncharacterized protein (TIGR02145 family)
MPRRITAGIDHQPNAHKMKAQFVIVIISLIISAYTSISFAQIPSYVPDSGLVAWYSFNGNANDESGNGNHGVVYGANIDTNRFGDANASYSYDGVNDYIDFGNIHGLDSSHTFTVSAWIYYSVLPSPPNDWYTIICDGGYLDPHGWGLMYNQNQLLIRNDNDIPPQPSNWAGLVSYSFNQNTWYNVTVSVGNDSIRMYVNGIKTSPPAPGAYPLNSSYVNLSTSGTLKTGKNSPQYSTQPYYCQGIIDDIGIWNRALSQQEITSLYTGIPITPNIPSYVPDSGLVAWYPFNGNANDESGNGHNGIINGPTSVADRCGNGNGAFSFNNETGSYNTISGSCTGFPQGNLPRTIAFWYNSQNFGQLAPSVASRQVLGYGGNVCGQSFNVNCDNTDIGAGFLGTMEIQGHCLAFRSYTSYPSPHNNIWHHIAITYDGSVLRFYFNGSLSYTSSAVSMNTISTGKVFVFGKIPNQTGTGSYDDPAHVGFTGMLDDIGIWNRALTPQEVHNLYLSPYQCLADTLVNLKVFPQSAWLTGDSLALSLNTQGMIPTAQPYDSLYWAYPGEESVSTVPADVTDWVLVELRTAVDTVIERRAGLLRNDGIILDTNGLPGLNFSSPAGNYYIAIQHRNHLPVMTQNKVAVPSSTLYNFTDTTILPVYGGCVITMPSGAEAMIAGDLNHDGILKYSGSGNDRGPVLQRIQQATGSTSLTTTLNGYYPEDIRMDGTVKYSGQGNDPSMIIQNLINLTGTTSITSTYSGCAPSPYIVPPYNPQTFQQCGDTLTDMRDGQKYPTVQIGTQCWMAKNLNTGYFNNSTPFYDSLGHSDVSDNGVIEKYCYDNDSSNCAIYGGLYDWNEAMSYDTTPGIQGICPSSWHIPTDEEWCSLTTFLDSTVDCGVTGGTGTDIGGQLREAGFNHWNSPNTGASNISGFSAFGSGYRNKDGGFAHLKKNTLFWTSSVNDTLRATHWGMYYIYTVISRNGTSYYYKSNGFSVRCLKD